MPTWHIHIEGQVQGVGFRPFVYKTAQDFGLKGWVNNSLDGVHVEFNADEAKANAFYETLIEQAPVLSQITRHKLQSIESCNFDRFQIVHSDSSGTANLLLSPDFGICPECKSELLEVTNRRNNYPFITCTNCGPRYSITRKVPYDRAFTTMDSFAMCSDCHEEYDSPLDRRYYSQTNSCPNCAIELSLYNANKEIVSKELSQISQAIHTAWNDGLTVAIKGIGGYLLTCNATNSDAVQRLRDRKYRPSKPFALMFPDIESIEHTLNIGPEEKRLLNYPVSSIVIATIRKDQSSELALEQIAPGLNYLGVMLPYTPLYELLLKDYGKPIVATSGNISNTPIVFEDEKALGELFEIADLVLSNNRDIVIPQDDSVVKFTPLSRQKIILRRSRGLAPTYINAGLSWPKQSVLATGAMLKSTFSLLHHQNSYLSQYLGDLSQFDTQENYRKTLDHFFQLLHFNPQLILSDLHPSYPSTHIGEQLAKDHAVEHQQIQHHQAHFAAIIGEYNLMHSDSPILGIIWDGTGYGTDGQIWGGEFFVYDNYVFTRANHFNYFHSLAGDKMAKEPRISALSLCSEVPGAKALLQDKFAAMEWKVYSRLLEKTDGLKTSSVGRIFDAVAAILGVCDQQSYEGEAAMLIEQLAQTWVNQNGMEFSDHYFDTQWTETAIPTDQLIAKILLDIVKGFSPGFIAAKFHYSLVRLIEQVAVRQKIKHIAFSGGVFQNSLLLDLLIQYLGTDYQLYFHKDLSPNDENISFGQLIYFHIEEQLLLSKNKSKNHVLSNSR